MIEYKLLKSALNGNVYPTQVLSQPFTKEDLKDKLEERYGSIAIAVVDDVFRVITDRIGQGNTVSIDDFGTFSLRLGMTKDNVKEYEDVRSQDIVVSGIRFNAAKRLRHSISQQSIHLVDGEKVMRKLTTDDRWVRLYDYVLNEHNNNFTPLHEITISVYLYSNITGCTDYTARKELALFEKEGKLRELHVSHNKLYVIVL